MWLKAPVPPLVSLLRSTVSADCTEPRVTVGKRFRGRADFVHIEELFLLIYLGDTGTAVSAVEGALTRRAVRQRTYRGRSVRSRLRALQLLRQRTHAALPWRATDGGRQLAAAGLGRRRLRKSRVPERRADMAETFAVRFGSRGAPRKHASVPWPERVRRAAFRKPAGVPSSGLFFDCRLDLPSGIRSRKLAGSRSSSRSVSGSSSSSEYSKEVVGRGVPRLAETKGRDARSLSECNGRLGKVRVGRHRCSKGSVACCHGNAIAVERIWKWRIQH
ncbi:hypothetical protein KC330_g61 [Hortaea werneckii]|nr:hypothetical protein KC330_g61 [Hortaea werneckii]